MQAALIAGGLDPVRFESLLACGEVPDGEASMLPMLEEYDPTIVPVPGLGRRISPRDDLRAIWHLTRLMRRFRPHVVHTHTAKAGFAGRLAALTIRPRPAVVHTFHGHVLDGYFGRAVTAVYRMIERLMALITDVLVVPSQATMDDLVRLRIARPAKFRVVPLGLDLERIAASGGAIADAAKTSLTRSGANVLCLFVGRLVQIKRVDVLLHAVAICVRNGDPIHLIIAGDGELRPELEQLAQDLGIERDVAFLGTREDVAVLAAAADVAVLSSDNEGTPVALIEASAAGTPSVATDVGGVRDVVSHESGIVVPAGDPESLAQGISALVRDTEMRQAMGEGAQKHVTARFSRDRLLRDTAAIYQELAVSRAGFR